MRNAIIFFTVVIAVAALSAVATRHFLGEPQPTPDAMHRWLHDRLGLTTEQRESLKAIEQRFAADEQRLRNNLKQANRDLARAIREDGNYTPRVTAAVEHVHHEMGELQKLSIAHLFEMTTVLTPEQSARLMEYAEMGLTETP